MKTQLKPCLLRPTKMVSIFRTTIMVLQGIVQINGASQDVETDNIRKETNNQSNFNYTT